MSLHTRIKEYRVKIGATQTELAEALGVAKTTVSGWEKNREPNAAQIGALSDFLGVGPEILLQDEMEKRKQPPEDGELSQAELDFFNEFRSLPQDHKGLAVALCTALLRELVKHQTIEIEKEASVPVGSSR